MTRRTARAHVLAVALAALTLTPLAAQDAQTLAAACDAQAGGDPTMCARTAGGGRDLLGDVGVLAGAGSEVPGQPSALGRRLGGTPRLAPSVRFGGHSVVLPDLTDPAGAGERSHFVPAVHGGLGLGVFDGFRLLPTVGGFLSVDLVGQASFLFFSESDGFDGRLDVLSLGARVGLLRESFTLPAVTVSVSRRFAGSLRLGSADTGAAGEVTLDPSVTSLRATVGKDLFSFGVLAGVGWDDYTSDTTVRVSDGGTGIVSLGETIGDSRTSYFVGLSKQVGVLSWISAEVGWARGFEPVALGAASSPERGATVFGSVALLFKL